MQIGDPAAQQRYTIDYAVTPRFSAGLEHTPGRQEVLPRAIWFVTPARGEAPSVVLGFTSDRLSTPKGQAVFLTFARSLGDGAVSPFVSLKYGTDMGRLGFPFGANWRLAPEWTLQTIYDTNHTHAVLTHTGEGVTASLVLARMKHPGVQLGFGF